MTIKCPSCQSSDLYMGFSPCKDSNCCGLPDMISCYQCEYEYETFREDLFEDKLKELGLTEEKYQKLKME